MMKKNARYRHWCFTLHVRDNQVLLDCWNNGIPPSRINDLLLARTGSYGIIGYEESPNSKARHFQGYIYCRNPVTFSGLKRHLYDDIHLESCKASYLDNIEYCKKDGRFTEIGTRPSNQQGHRSDLESMCQNIIQDPCNYTSTIMANPSTFVRNHNGCRYLLSETLTSHCRKYVRPKHVICVNQNFFERHIQMFSHEAFYTFSPMFLGYKGEPTIILHYGILPWDYKEPHNILLRRLCYPTLLHFRALYGYIPNSWKRIIIVDPNISVYGFFIKCLPNCSWCNSEESKGDILPDLYNVAVETGLMHRIRDDYPPDEYREDKWDKVPGPADYIHHTVINNRITSGSTPTPTGERPRDPPSEP